MKTNVRFIRKAHVGLFAFLCAASAQVHADVPAEAPNPALDEGGPAGIGLPGELEPKHYKVEAIGFKCIDEVSWDSPFWAPWISDEVVVGIDTSGASTVSRVFGDVDTGESRSFQPDQSCILPIEGESQNGDRGFDASFETWTCARTGTPGPFSFTVVMAEEDSGILHDCFDEFPWACKFGGGVPDFNDDLIGRHMVEFTAEELAAAMPNVGDTFEETITLGPCFDERGCVTSFGTPNDAEYRFTYRLTRLPAPGILLDPTPSS
jgi:hypothetical protein